MERRLQRVILPDVVHHFILLVESSRAESARIFAADVNVVHVIEEIRFHPESLAANVTNELLALLNWLRVEKMFLFMILERDKRRQSFPAN